MTEIRRCPTCGVPLADDAPGGLCAKCLMRQGMESTVGYDAAQAPEMIAGQSFGPYRIVRLLGQGGMGSVYEADDENSGRRVALKVLNHKLQSPEHRQRFLREGRLAASVNHPNNVYIYGTHEIEGRPVIAMELAAGGTLQERIQREGPLPMAQSVDVILDVIAGLEAAQAAGVLHRDVKPSNCFLDLNGVVKIGDFGLSISKALRGDTNLTQTGVFLGTPVFSSPEQLRGDELDVRSDIYSVGVTLYYLLTGKPPFEAKQMVQLLATVLERPAPSPRDARPEIPPGLARIVQRCLAKQNTQRFRDYDELRQALLPYRSTAPNPATLGFRFLAYAFDGLVLIAIAALLPLLWVRDMVTWQTHFDVLSDPGPQSNPALYWLISLGAAIYVGYFSLFEGIWGASPGKAICRLRVVRPDRDVAGVARALLRVTLFAVTNWLPWWIIYALNTELGRRVFQAEFASWTDLILLWGCELSVLLLFVSVRRSNGYAAVHELVSGTRVVRLPAVQARPGLSLENAPLPESSDAARIGPYDILGPLPSPADQPTILAYDTRLLRKIWIRPCRPDAPAIPAKQRELARIGRLRWLNGQRGPEGGWDAYEAPTGKPLLNLIAAGPQPWDAVRFWLLDLAVELHSATAEDSLPDVLDLDRVWITADGRAKLLDFAAPELCEAPPVDGHNGSTVPIPAVVFLKRVALATLEGSIPSEHMADSSRQIECHIPLPARSFLNTLGGPECREIPVAELDLLTRKPATVSSQRRLGLLAACWLLTVAMACIVMLYLVSERRVLRKYPEVGQLTGYVDYYRSLTANQTSAANTDLRRAVAIVIAHRFRKLIDNDDFWSNEPVESFVEKDDYRMLRQMVADHPNPTVEEIAAAQKLLRPVQSQIYEMSWALDNFLYASPLLLVLLMFVAMLMCVFVAIPSLVSAAVFGDTLLLRLLEIAVVDKTGAPASRIRLFWRNLLLWLMVLTCLGLLMMIAHWGRLRIGFFFIIYWMVQMFIAERTAHDALAKTWLVPR